MFEDTTPDTKKGPHPGGDRDTGHVVHAGTGGFQHGLQIGQGLPGLLEARCSSGFTASAPGKG